MTRHASEPEQEPKPSHEAAPSARDARRAYRSPKLRHLGSVRDLTLGSIRGKPEGGGTLRTTM